VTHYRQRGAQMRFHGPRMDALDDHLERINAATPDDWEQLLEHFVAQCDPLVPSELRPLRGTRVPDDEWETSPEYEALLRMFWRCWPTERSQRQ
jgi:hypothetical protein